MYVLKNAHKSDKDGWGLVSFFLFFSSSSFVKFFGKTWSFEKKGPIYNFDPLVAYRKGNYDEVFGQQSYVRGPV